jgi:hypothetical protein
MSDNEQALYENVLNEEADDYESFEYLLEHSQNWANERGESVTRDEVAAALVRAIREGDAKAYLLSPHPPHSQVAEFSLDRIDDLWFYVTPKGKQFVAKS